MADIIEIDNSSIPYSFEIEIKEVTFKLLIKSFTYNDRIYVDLYDADDNLIYSNEKMVFGIALWQSVAEDSSGNRNTNFPQAYLIPYSLDGEEVEINSSTIGETVFLTYQEEDD